MMRWVAIGGLCLALLFAGVSSYLVWRNGHLREDLDAVTRRLRVAERQADDARQTADVLNAHIKRMQEDRRAYDADLRRLRKQEGYNAPLSDFLGDVFDRL
ncbi:hypothetical protein D1822_10805 [Phaeobacter inhibens]|uniref:hypothetical protein n=1 Tax=Phaeobacter inhibens TaxID=221822 RepID=UPI0001632FC5|nr:hypothetical protein [Phaeobacter inhibens]AFO91910.1 hypothetical protein PGA1_c22240 [Phaeobacter inhibens DSM 17395]AUQ46578.1 hypothetical protein PhaeoP10_02248 [Phaeobacter inhibens]AUR04233.1 hypothetical protein PhaeoP72_02272 [Phaeobacter inhibens]AXT23271.1 hypothetical protein D1822_10805 [Phaeobacter inhibens]